MHLSCADIFEHPRCLKSLDMEPELRDPGMEEIEFSVELKEDELRSDQLGGSQVVRNGEQYQDQPRKEVTTMQAGSTYVGVRCQRPHYGLAKNNDAEPQDVHAALIVLELSFQPLKNSRLKLAGVQIEVEDSATLNLNAHQMQIDSNDQPVILRWVPEDYKGPVTQIIGHRSREFGVSVSDPSQVLGANARIGSATATLEEGFFSIDGVPLGDRPSAVRWVLREDKIKKGLPKQVKLGLIVKCTPSRKFAARVKVTANIWRGKLQLVAGEKDDPLFFTPPTDIGQDMLDEKLAEIDRIDYERSSHIQTVR